MSLATSLRSFLRSMADQPIDQIAQQHIPENYNPANGFIFYARRSTQTARTFAQATVLPEQQYFDLEIYHPDLSVAEATADRIQMHDAYCGAFGAGTVQAFFVDTQSDDYVPQVNFDDEQHMSSAFLSIEVRSYTE